MKIMGTCRVDLDIMKLQSWILSVDLNTGSYYEWNSIVQV